MNQLNLSFYGLLLFLAAGCAMTPSSPPPQPLSPPVPSAIYYDGTFNTSERLGQYAVPVWGRLHEPFTKTGVAYLPKRITLLALKQEKILELWADDGHGPRFIKSYPFTAFSGGLGPKLRQGDGQIPEGIYQVESLNPNSSYHLSIKLNYPNAFDRAMGREDGRSNLGNNIFIHGKDKSIGCVAIGDQAIEELFVLTAAIGTENVSVLIAPVDFRNGKTIPSRLDTPWASQLYSELRYRMMPYRLDSFALFF